MKITSAKVRLLAVPPPRFYSHAREKPEFSLTWEFPLLELATDTGLRGYAMGRGLQGQGRALAYTLHDVYGARLLGVDPLRESERLWQDLKRGNRHLYSTTDAPLGVIDTAIWDLRGKAAGLPIAALLGQFRAKVPSYATIARQQLETPAAVIESCAAARQAGFNAIKLQFWNGPEHDIPRLREARRAAGDAFRLMFDAAGGYNFTEALRVGHALDDLGFHWFEEPIPDAQIGRLGELRRKLRLPILATETARIGELHTYLREGAVDLMRGDVYITAGITGLRKAMAMAELFGVNMEIHAAGASLLDVAHLHVACAARNCEYVELPPAALTFGLAGQPLSVGADGQLTCPTGPGLGVELDWDWINAHTVLTLEAPDA